jgi:hypothetical protein
VLCLHLGLLLLISFPDLTAGMVLLHSFTFYPAWLRCGRPFKRMAKHMDFTVATDVQVYFCDPQSPWQRGSNETQMGYYDSTSLGEPTCLATRKRI